MLANMLIRYGRRFFSRMSSVRREGRVVEIEWEDGEKGSFPLVWMRDCSPDTHTYTISPAMTARNLYMNSFDVEVEPLSFSVAEDGSQLVVDWPGSVRSSLSSEWLRLRNPSSKEVMEKRRRWHLLPMDTWDAEHMQNNLKTFEYDQVMKDDKALHDWLEAVCFDGIAVLKKGPRGRRGAVEEIGRRIGFIQRTHFGTVFEVSTKPDASNMAYASPSTLPFHTDFPSLSDPPQLQMLHVLVAAEEGGRSLFVDGFRVAEQLRSERPDVFSLLCRYGCEFIEEGFDTHEGPSGSPSVFNYNMAAWHKTIKTDVDGRVVRVQFGNAMRSCHFECPPQLIQDLYRALKIFTDYCYQERNVLKLRLEPGDTVLWANTRLLHTREGYVDSPSAPRTLTGCYFSWDIVKSRVRQVARSLSLPHSQAPV